MIIKQTGFGLKPERYDALTVECIPDKHWSGESQLFGTKWWDYRLMHPLQATYHFAYHYKRAYQAAFAQRDDRDRAYFVRGIGYDDFLECAASTRTAVYLARKAADRVGCPYSFYCATAMKYAARRNWQQLPRPQAMYSERPMYDEDVSLFEYIAQRWRETCQTELRYSRDEFYQVANFIRNPHQIEHQRMLIKAVEKRVNPVMLLSTLIFEHDVLAPDLVIHAFGEEKGASLVRRAEKYAV